MVTRRIDKKPSHRSSGTSEDKFLIGDPNSQVKELQFNIPGDAEAAMVYDSETGEFYKIRNQADRDAFEAGSLAPMQAQGETGVAGIDGQTGPQGVTGMIGPTGLIGVTGVIGLQGITGLMGDTGLAIQGVTGLQGIQGLQGNTGAQGLQGATGLAGIQGDTGLAGAVGAQGTTGLAGIQGDTGLAGAGGTQGQTGLTGAAATIFVSAEQTGTGANQDIAHGLGGVPSAVLVSVTDDNSAAGFVITEGVHDATNVKVTCTASAKYKVLAFA